MRMLRLRFWRAGLLALIFAVSALAGTAWIADRLDRLYPPPLERLGEAGSELRDRNGNLLRAFASQDGRWRLAVDLDQVDPEFLRMLIAYEDRRFHAHHGIDLLALGRAALQMGLNG